LKDKYGGCIRYLGEDGDANWPLDASSWWNELMSIEGAVGWNWFKNGVVRIIGDGDWSSFWKDIWVGTISFHNMFPRLFSMSAQKEAKFGDLWVGGEGGFVWQLH